MRIEEGMGLEIVGGGVWEGFWGWGVGGVCEVMGGEGRRDIFGRVGSG